MKSIRGRGLLVIVISSAFLAEPTQSAGFFDELARVLFGRSTPPPVYYIEPDPLDVTVRPVRRPKPRKVVAPKPVLPVAKLDPATDPYWYLSDPTLRAGDIVVTNSDVLVFEGRVKQNHQAAEFTALGKSSLVSKATQQKVGASVGRPVPAQAAGAGTLAVRDSGN